MNRRNISWEIIVAGLAFIGIGIYLLDNSASSHKSSGAFHHRSHAPKPPSEHLLPGAIVIDLENIESLKNLEDLKNLHNLKDIEKLEVKIKGLDKVIEKYAGESVQESLKQSLKELETELQKMDNGDFNVKLQDKKLYINKNYNVEEAKWTEVDPGVFVFKESFPVSNMESMDLKLAFGNLNIVGGSSDQGKITFQATGNIEDSETLSKRMNIQKKLNIPNAEYRLTSTEGDNISDQVNLQATLTLPEDMQVTASISGGHVNATNLTNSQNLSTSGGHIVLTNIKGKTVAKTSGGHITGDQIAGTIHLSTGGGHIKVDNINGSLSAKTGGGHIEIQEASGSITAKTSGGHISSSVQKADGPLQFTTSAGNISLYLPTDISADLDVSGSSVSLSDAFNFNGTANEGKISGSINGGGLPVVINCGYGNVSISPSK